MEELRATVDALLKAQFPDAVIELEETVPGVKLGGALTTSRFLGMEQIKRQRLLWQTLRRRLSRNDQLRLGTILTLTPQEVSAMEDLAAA